MCTVVPGSSHLRVLTSYSTVAWVQSWPRELCSSDAVWVQAFLHPNRTSRYQGTPLELESKELSVESNIARNIAALWTIKGRQLSLLSGPKRA